MDNNTVPFNKILRQLSHISPKYCDRCGLEHNKEDFTVVDQNDQRMVCKLSCSNCKNTYLIHIHNTPEGMVTKRSNIKSEISHAEYKKFADLEAIDSEEILDVFIALEEVDSIQDFEDLVND